MVGGRIPAIGRTGKGRAAGVRRRFGRLFGMVASEEDFHNHDGFGYCVGGPWDMNGVGPESLIWLAMYSSLTERDGRRIFWYPNRKHLLLGREIPHEWLGEVRVPGSADRQWDFGRSRKGS